VINSAKKLSQILAKLFFEFRRINFWHGCDRLKSIDILVEPIKEPKVKDMGQRF
jgi:hypothetical protein